MHELSSGQVATFLGVETSSHLGVYIMLIYLLVSPLLYNVFVLSIYPFLISERGTGNI